MPVKPNSNRARRPGRGAEKMLGDLELAIMRVAWSRQSVTVRDVLDVLNKTRRLAYTTVMTVMGRLANKGLFIAEKAGKTYRYRAAFTQEEFDARTAGQVVGSLIADFGGEVAISQFVRKLAEADPVQLNRLAELARQATEADDDD